MRPWLLWASVALAVILSTATVLWWQLPRWAPLFVIEHSPWVEPTLRANKAANKSVPGYVLNVLWARLRGWDGDCVPGLIACLRHRDPEIRWITAMAFESTIS